MARSSSAPDSPVRHVFVTGGVASSLGKGLTASSLGRLLKLWRRMKAAGGRLVLCDLSPTFEELLQVTHLNDIFEVRTDVAAAVESLDRLLYLTSYRGIFSAEFKFDARDQLFKILEINARPWWYVEFAARCGVDVCGMAYQDAIRQPFSSSSDYKVGRRCVFLIQDYRGRRASPPQGRSGFWSWIRSWLGAHDALFSWDDPRPALSEAARLFASRRGRTQPTINEGTM